VGDVRSVPRLDALDQLVIAAANDHTAVMNALAVRRHGVGVSVAEHPTPNAILLVVKWLGGWW
jgi:hypothetical protein